MATQKQAGQQGSKSEQQSAQQSQRAVQRSGRGGGQPQQGGLSQRGQFVPLIAASPFTLMRRFNEDIGRLFEDFMLGGGSLAPGASGPARAMASSGPAAGMMWAPQIEVFEREGNLVIRADLPGVNKEDVRVEVKDDSIVIQGQRQEQQEEQRGDVYVSEVVRGSFYREIPLPEGVNADNATAIVRDGVLEIVIPEAKREQRGRHLEIQDASQSGQQQQTQAQTQPQSQAASGRS